MLGAWTDLFSNSTALRTIVTFGHVGGLLLGGGCAIAADFVILSGDTDDRIRMQAPLRAHRLVLVGLSATIVSGALLLLSNMTTYLTSAIFWVKIVMVFGLALNGRQLMVAARLGPTGGARHRACLRRAAAVSVTLWFLVVLLGAALPNL